MNKYVDEILLNICAKLQLQESSYKSAEERYHSVERVLQQNSIFKDIELEIYPHGSFRLKTTVKPIKGNEFDLDFVCEIAINAQTQMTPHELYDHIYEILATNDIYKDMVEKKSRCIRINYKNDFHMDIMPAKQINSTTREIIVPDKESQHLDHHSNPIAYANWFEEKARKQILFELNESRKVLCSAEPIEEQEIVSRLEPLRRAVQLIKRYRDIYSDKTGEEAVRSIVICTLMGQVTSSLGDSLKIISDFCLHVKSLIESNNDLPFTVINPVVDEVLTEKWEENPQNFYDFKKMIYTLAADVKLLQSISSNSELDKLMKKMFGETIANEAIKDYAKRINNERQQGTLTIDSMGRLNSIGVGTVVQKNTFYGEDKV